MVQIGGSSICAFPVAVVGGGVVGLAVAARLARLLQQRSAHVVVLERERLLATHQSSRNSEVIHAGLYYPRDALKTRLCVRGKHLLYEFAREHRIPHQQTGKWIFATSERGHVVLDKMLAHAQCIGVPLYLVDKQTVQREQPNLRATKVIASPTTGIICSHTLVETLREILASTDSPVMLRSTVKSVKYDPATQRYLLTVLDQNQKNKADEEYMISCSVVVNAAGLESDLLFRMLCESMKVSFPTNEYTIYPMRGHYFQLRKAKKHSIQRLLYPLPEFNLSGLGIHATLDLSGNVKFGPDTCTSVCDRTLTYDIESNEIEQQLQIKFHQAISSYLDGINLDDLQFTYSGIRARTTPIGESVRDFIVKEESDRGFPGWINCIGIESPGLTSSLAIAEYIEEMMYNRLMYSTI